SVICTGPLTPLAAAMDKNAGTAKNAKKIAIMGGAYNDGAKDPGKGYAGYNLRADIPAAEKVLTSGGKIVLVGTDSTRKIKLTPSYIGETVERSKTSFAEKYRAVVELWRKRFESEGTFPKGLYIQDALTVAYLMYPYETRPVVLALRKGTREFMGDKTSPALFMDAWPVPEKLSNVSIVTDISNEARSKVLKTLSDSVFSDEYLLSEVVKRKERMYKNFFKIRVNPLLEGPYDLSTIDSWSQEETESALAILVRWGWGYFDAGKYHIDRKNVFNEMIALWAEFTYIDAATGKTLFDVNALDNVGDKNLYPIVQAFQKDFDAFVQEHRAFFARSGYFDRIEKTLKKDVKGVSNVFICYRKELNNFINQRLGDDADLLPEEVTEMFEGELMEETGLSRDDIQHRIYINGRITENVLRKVAEKLDQKLDAVINEFIPEIQQEFDVVIENGDDSLGHELYHQIVLAGEEGSKSGQNAVLEGLAKDANKARTGAINRDEAVKRTAEAIKNNPKLRRKLASVPLDRIIQILKKGKTGAAFEALVKKFELYTVVKKPKTEEKTQTTPVRTLAKPRAPGVTRPQARQAGVNLSPETDTPDAGTPEATGDASKPAGEKSEEIPFFDDLTEKARKGEIDPCFYRNAELAEMVEILNRGQNSNPMILGAAGVGKTNLVEGLAVDIVNKETGSPFIDSMKILSLNLASFYTYAANAGAGAAIEAFLKKASEPNVIVFIDEFHPRAPARSPADQLKQQFYQFIKPALSRGKVKLIATTTDKEFKKYIEGDEAFERRFGAMTLESMSVSDTIDTMLAIKDFIVRKHNMKTEDAKKHIEISEEAVEYAARLTSQYLKNMGQPAVTRDVLDQAASIVFGKAERTQAELVKLRKELLRQLNLFNQAKSRKYASGMKRAARRITEDLETYSAAVEKLTKGFSLTVRKEDVEEVMKKRGIPIGTEFVDRLKTLEKSLKKKIKGQDEAIDQVVKTIRRNYFNPKRKKPLGVFYFEGPNGVGKSELSKILAEDLFGDSKALVDDIKGTELMEEHEISKIIGSPPGYVGSDRSGLLVMRVKDRPYSVILVDEIDKAHEKALITFLGMIEDGKITDQRTQKQIDFTNTIIIFTSNMAKDGQIVATDEEASGLAIKRKRRANQPWDLIPIPEDKAKETKAKKDTSILDYPNEKYHEFVRLLMGREQAKSEDFATFLNKIGKENTLLFNKITREVAEGILREVNLAKMKNAYAEGNHDFPLDIEFVNPDKLIEFLLEDFSDRSGMRPAINKFDDVVASGISDIVQNEAATVINPETYESKEVPVSKGDTIRIIYDENMQAIRFEVAKEENQGEKDEYFDAVKSDAGLKILERMKTLLDKKSDGGEINMEEFLACLDEKPENLAENVTGFVPRAALTDMEGASKTVLGDFTPEETELALKTELDKIEKALEEKAPALKEEQRKEILTCVKNVVEEIKTGVRDQVTRTNTQFLTFKEIDASSMEEADKVAKE
ncbi:MAG: AAA family ATPase, partial [Candidatus Omnitrophica bacterium]|nr:AAA family ATPase [Candidatus Omnitrophota bacterium]